MKSLIYIANWKLFLSFNQARAWLDQYNTVLATFAPQKFILCPSFDVLSYAAPIAQKNNFLLGAQDCSEHDRGAYTGQISAKSLADIGCGYCIVGHSEQRAHLTNTIIFNKLEQLATHAITPILCIGQASAEQLEPAREFIKNYPTKELFIAYEPPASIGTGVIASQENIITTLKHIRSTIAMAQVKFLYGGSIVPDNCAPLKSIDGLDGFLIGSASTNIDTLHAIIQAQRHRES